MLKRRVIVLLTFLDGVLFRTKKFVPDYRYTLSQVDLSSCDEAVCIHLGGDWNEFRKSVCWVADNAMCPLAVGGGIRTFEKAVSCFRGLPADKLVLGPSGWQLARRLSDKIGAQSVVLGYTHGKDSDPRTVFGAALGGGSLFDDNGAGRTDNVDMGRKRLPPARSGRSAGPGRHSTDNMGRLPCRTGAGNTPYGEILLQSVERDGSLSGLDLGLLETWLAKESVPIVIGSGVGSWVHMRQGFEAGAAGVATNNIFHFTNNSLAVFKRNLAEAGLPIRSEAA